MPYIAWNESQPVGSVTAANTLDTIVQDLKISVRERMQGLGATNWATDDPLKFSNLILGGSTPKIYGGATSILFRDAADANTNVTITNAGNVTVRGLLTASGGLSVAGQLTSLVIPAQAFQLDSSTVLTTKPSASGGYQVGAPGASLLSLIAPLVLPTGAIIKNITFYGYTDITATASIIMTLWSVTLTSSPALVDTVSKVDSWTGLTRYAVPFAVDINDTVDTGVGYVIKINMTSAVAGLSILVFNGVKVDYTTAPIV